MLAVALGLFSVLSLLASWKGDQAREGWKRTLGTPEELLARFPAREADPAALDIEARAAELGIDIATRPGPERRRPTPESAKQFPSKELGAYVSGQLQRSEPGVDPPPPAVASFLDRHREKIDALSQALRAAVPSWELRLDKLSATPVPNLMGHTHLQKLLIADALAAVAAGRVDTAIADLEASSQLNRALLDDPIVITQLVATSLARMQFGALRRLPRVPPAWRERLGEHDFRQSMLTALQVEGWSWTQFPPAELTSSSSFARSVVSTVGAPYARLCVSDVSEAFRRRIETLKRLDEWCLEPTAASALNLEVPRWNVIGRILASNFDGIVARVARLEVDRELTAKLLELQEAREAGGGVWPATLTGIERSAACPHDRWVYEVTPHGGMSLALSGEPSWPESSGLVWPTRYASSAP